MTSGRAGLSSYDQEVINYETEVGGQVFLIAITRATIEVYLGKGTSTIEECLAFVNSNMPMLTTCAVEKLRRAPDSTSTLLTRIDLPDREL